MARRTVRPPTPESRTPMGRVSPKASARGGRPPLPESPLCPGRWGRLRRIAPRLTPRSGDPGKTDSHARRSRVSRPLASLQDSQQCADPVYQGALTGREAVAEAGDGLQRDARVAVGLELAAQALDVRVDGVVVDVGEVAPHL